MNQTYIHSFTSVLQPFYLYLLDNHKIVQSCFYDGTTLTIKINTEATEEEQTELSTIIAEYIAESLDVSKYEAIYQGQPIAIIESTEILKTASFHAFLKYNHSDWFEGIGQGRGMLSIFLKRSLTLQEEILVYGLAKDYLEGNLDLSLYDLQYEIKQGIQRRKQIGIDFVENQYTTVMLGVVTGNSTEDFSNLVEDVFHPAIVHMQNGLFISSYNAVIAVDPAQVTSIPEIQAALSNLKASYEATILQLCYENYPASLLENTPSIPSQNP